MTKILIFGDLHFKVDNIIQMKHYIEKIKYWLEQNAPPPDIFILLGDILHYHERLHTNALNQFDKMLSALCTFGKPIIILVGNHDMINHKQYLSNHHWMNILKHIPNIYIIDHTQSFTIQNFTFVCCPYVPNGSFKQAIQDILIQWVYNENTFEIISQDIKNVDIYFAHQEFKGCSMGFISSETGDEWELNMPFVLSGHIHQKQQPQQNIVYVGSAIQDGPFGGEYGIVSELCIHENTIRNNTSYVIQYDSIQLHSYIQLKYYKLSIPQHIIKSYNIQEITENTIHQLVKLKQQTDLCETLKINIKSSIEEFKAFKKSIMFQTLQTNNIYITLKPIEISTSILDKEIEIPYFLKELEDILKNSEHSDMLLELFYKCIQ